MEMCDGIDFSVCDEPNWWECPLCVQVSWAEEDYIEHNRPYRYPPVRADTVPRPAFSIQTPLLSDLIEAERIRKLEALQSLEPESENNKNEIMQDSKVGDEIKHVYEVEPLPGEEYSPMLPNPDFEMESEADIPAPDYSPLSFDAAFETEMEPNIPSPDYSSTSPRPAFKRVSKSNISVPDCSQGPSSSRKRDSKGAIIHSGGYRCNGGSSEASNRYQYIGGTSSDGSSSNRIVGNESNPELFPNATIKKQFNCVPLGSPYVKIMPDISYFAQIWHEWRTRHIPKPPPVHVELPIIENYREVLFPPRRKFIQFEEPSQNSMDEVIEGVTDLSIPSIVRRRSSRSIEDPRIRSPPRERKVSSLFCCILDPRIRSPPRGRKDSSSFCCTL